MSKSSLRAAALSAVAVLDDAALSRIAKTASNRQDWFEVMEGCGGRGQHPESPAAVAEAACCQMMAAAS